jgi:microcystin-dependent protein
MNNLYNLSHIVNTLNTQSQTLPYIQELIYNMSLHVGEYKMSARTTDFNGWFLCDGRSVERNTYPALYEIIGTSFGSIDSNTFNIPNFNGRVFGQIGSSNILGTAVGSETHTLSVNEIPSHRHTGTTVSAGAHIHTAACSTAGNHAHTITDPGHTHTQTTINDDFNNSGATPPGFSADSAGSMTWNNINSSTTGITINSNGDHNHNVTIASNGSHSHTFNTDYFGGGLAHNNMQPTLFGGNIFIFTGLVV